MEKQPASQLELNEIGRCHFELNAQAQFDLYEDNLDTGSFVIIDRLTNGTVGAGMIAALATASDKPVSDKSYSSFELELNALIRKQYPHWQARDISKD